jgi:hypothetical protein
MRFASESQDWSIHRAAAPSSRAGLKVADLVDYGLSRDEIDRLTLLSPEQIDRRNRMARLNGLDSKRLEEDRALDIATALCCADCGSEGRCCNEVEDATAGAGAGFCANVATFGGLAAE